MALLDPTLLPNDAYTVVLKAIDLAGNETIVEQPYSIAGNFKIGHFSTVFTDLSVPLGGIPLTIARAYSSLDVSTGDFGPGWRLHLPGQVCGREEESMLGSLADPFLHEPYSFSTRVYVTGPDGRRLGFTFTPIQNPVLPVSWSPAFTADEGIDSTLEVDGGPNPVILSGQHFLNFFLPYNPDRFILTTNGVKYFIDEYEGLTRIEDIAGNSIDVLPEGLFSSLGPAILFERDPEGRISRIIEPDDDPRDGIPPGDLEYLYDPVTGNLTTFRDQLDQDTTYEYDNPQFPHYLTGLEDPLGRTLLRTVYDENGRIVAQCGADGDPVTLAGCQTFSVDTVNRIQTTFDGDGRRQDRFFDELGNLIKRRRWLDEVEFVDTDFTYDEAGRILTQTDGGMNVSILTYDEDGNLTTQTNPAGDIFVFTYNDCGEIESMCNPNGDCTIYTYDANCNVSTITDPLGNVRSYIYNDLGRLTSFIDGEGSVWQFLYDDRGLYTGAVDPRGHEVTAVYNLAGELLELTDFNGRTIIFEYDDAHNITRETWDSGY